MTIKLDINQLKAERTFHKAQADKHYARAKEYDFEINIYMREHYADEYKRLEQGKSTTFKAEGVQLSRRREYDMNALRAAIGETHPDVFQTVTTEKIDGNAMRKLWSDAALAGKLADTLIPAAVTVKVVA